MHSNVAENAPSLARRACIDFRQHDEAAKKPQLQKTQPKEGNVIDRINQLSRESFIRKFQFLFEHSPWVVESIADDRPFVDVDAMHLAMIMTVARSGIDKQLSLLRAHPQLADRVAIANGLTRESASEQASVGLDLLTEAEFERFHVLNRAYHQKFDFPFIICVRLTDKEGILSAMESRLANDAISERETALEEVYKIVGLRLIDAAEDNSE